MKRLTLLFLLIFAVVVNSYACRCSLYSSLDTFMEEKFKASDFVISAKVEFVRDSLTKGDFVMSSDPMYWRQGGYNPVLKVTNVYKGTLKSDIMEITPRWSNCSQYFKTGDTYIIFGYVNSKGEFTTDVCAGNFSTIEEDRLKVFKAIRKE